MDKIGYSTWFTDARYIVRMVLCRTEVSDYQGWAITGLGMAPDRHWRLNSTYVVELNIFLYLPSHHPAPCRENYWWDILKPRSLLVTLLYFPLVQTSHTSANNFQISAKCLIAMVTAGGTGESCRFCQCQRQKIERRQRHNSPWLSGHKMLSYEIQEKASKWLVKDREEKVFLCKMYQLPFCLLLFLVK